MGFLINEKNKTDTLLKGSQCGERKLKFLK